MWLYRHHTADDIIDLDHETGRWRFIEDSERPANARVLADLDVAGSYEIESEKYFFSYWTPDKRFVFRSFDHQIIEICRKDSAGSITMLDPELRCEIAPAHHADGRLRQNLSEVKIFGGNGQVLFEFVYNSEFYRRLYNSDFTASASIRSLSDWDFFVALKECIPLFKERFESGRVALTLDANQSVSIGAQKVAKEDLLFAESGDQCARSGVWAAVDDLRHHVVCQKGDVLPEHKGRRISWVWSRDR